MSSYTPTSGNITQLIVQLGVVNTNVSGSTNVITVNVSNGFSFQAADATNGCVMMIMGAGVGGAPLWTTVQTYISSSQVNINVSISTTISGQTAILFRPITQTTNAHLLIGSVDGNSSIRNYPTFNFSVYSSDGTFIPVPGQPILVTHTVYGDQFGGYIEQATPENMPGSYAITTHCEGVSWNKILARRLLYLANVAPSPLTQQFSGGTTPGATMDGTNRNYNLDFIPITVTAINIEGVCTVISGTMSNTATDCWGPQMYQGIGAPATVGGTNYPLGSVFVNGVQYGITSIPNTNSMTLAGSPPDQSAVPYYIPQTFNTLGADTVSQWFWSQTSNIVTQGYASTTPGSLAETLIPTGGTFDMLSITFTYQAQLIYTNIAVNDLINALIGLIANEGITTSITLASNAPTIQKIEFTNKDTIDSALAAIVAQINDGTNNYWYQVSPRKVLTFNIIGITTVAPFNITTSDGSDGNAEFKIDNTITLEKYVNAAVVELASAQGANQLSQSISNHTGDTEAKTPRSWSVSSPIATTPTVVRNTMQYAFGGSQLGYQAFPQTVGLLNVDSGMDWYWSPGSATLTQDPVIGYPLGWDITLDSPLTPTNVSETLEVTYYPSVSLVQTYSDSAAIAARAAIEGGSGEYDAYNAPASVALISGSANADYAQAIVYAYNAESQTVKVVTNKGGLASAQSITLGIPELGISGTFVVDNVNIRVEQTITKWTVTLVVGAVIGDWKTAWKSLGGGETGISGVGSQANQTAGTIGAPATPTPFLAAQATYSWNVNNAGELDLSISVTPPNSIGTTTGAHIYLEIPDVSSSTSATAGNSSAGDGSGANSQWSPMDVGKFVYNVLNPQPWLVPLTNATNLLWPDGNQTPVTIRIYVQAFSPQVDPPPVEANQINPTLSITLPVGVVSQGKPGSGSGITEIQNLGITATVLANVSVGGQLMTPILINVQTPTQVPIGWGFSVQAYINGDLTQNPIFTCGPFLGSTGKTGSRGAITDSNGNLLNNGGDGIATPHTFALVTPTSVETIVLFAIAGSTSNPKIPVSVGSNRNTLSPVTAGVAFYANNIVIGITPAYIITVGTTGGTIDPTQLVQTGLDDTLQIISGQLKVIGANVIAGAVASGAITAASGALAADSVVSGNILSASVSSLINGTVVFTGPVYLSQGLHQPVIALLNSGVYLYGEDNSSSGGSPLTSKPYVAVTSTSVALFQGSTDASVVLTAGTVTLYQVNGTNTSPYMSLTSAGVSIVNGIYSTVLGANSIVLTDGTHSVTINTSGVTIVGGILNSPVITVVSGAITVNIDGTNIIKVTDTSTSQFMSLTYNGLTLNSITGGGNSIAYSLTGITWDNGGTNVILLNLAGGNVELTLTNSSFTDVTILGSSGFIQVGTQVAFTGTLAAAIAAGYSVLGGIIVS